MGLRIFPVSGGAQYTNDWAEPRSDGRSHLGNDLFAEEGTPLLAVDDGEIRFGDDKLGGNIANLYADDGTRYYYAHLQGFEGESRRRVNAGQTIGYLGRTGNAINTPPHVHFEVHPGNGDAINPFPYLNDSEVTTGSGGGAVRLWPIIAAIGIGFGAWAWQNPRKARRLFRV